MSSSAIASVNHQFDVLLEITCVKLQLTKTQFTAAESRYQSIGDWLLAPDSGVSQYSPQIYPQGSLDLGTTVKPHGANEFDLDLVCQLQLPANYHPGTVFQAIWDRMAAHETYRKMIKRLRRCIRVEYANDFHLDIVPAIPDPDEAGDHILVPDLHADLEPEHPKNNIWKPSNPRGYKAWFKSKCARALRELRANAEPLPKPEPIHHKPALKRAVQLFKRWRDIKFADQKHLEPPSIILTTLAGQLHAQELLCADALDTILDGIVEMRDNDEILCQTNPANDKECICERWLENPESLKAFDIAIYDFHNTWKRLLGMRGIPEITAELKRLFGETPIDAAVKELAERNLNRPRQQGQLLMERETRRVVDGSKAAAILGAGTLPIKDTTFYGDE